MPGATVPNLIGHLCQLVDVFTGHKDELTFRTLFTALQIRFVFVALIKSFDRLFRRPFDDQENLGFGPVSFEFFHARGSSQISAAVLFNKFRYILDVV